MVLPLYLLSPCHWCRMPTRSLLHGRSDGNLLPSLRSGPPGKASFSENCLILFHLSHSIAGQRLRTGRSCDAIQPNCYTVKRKWDGMGRLIRGRQGGLWGWVGCQHSCTLAHLCVFVNCTGNSSCPTSGRDLTSYGPPVAWESERVRPLVEQDLARSYLHLG